ncbi:hypothetical protein Esi_0140_0045 [Ectocarpus siliculosus]|uniref:Uncharacterized protein n=1 Tax=Ectocarpus siliculosus TaxID=2880 RepID=D7FK44_ECTSI|nr:hypothetical protein Esi_0140_0045 [Ectocarpus siliculosus]|eukprot:CBJ29254.1 hypothetical protein Esi_0140_0045 [Ectocarpus siliculosus]
MTWFLSSPRFFCLSPLLDLVFAPLGNHLIGTLRLHSSCRHSVNSTRRGVRLRAKEDFGHARSPPRGGTNDEREQTLNQILTEMDGFRTALNFASADNLSHLPHVFCYITSHITSQI